VNEREVGGVGESRGKKAKEISQKYYTSIPLLEEFLL